MYVHRYTRFAKFNAKKKAFRVYVQLVLPNTDRHTDYQVVGRMTGQKVKWMDEQT